MGIETMLLGAVATLWGLHMISWRNLHLRIRKCEKDRERLWEEIFKLTGVRAPKEKRP